MTLLIAVWGAVLATVVAIVQFSQVWSRRPRLRVNGWVSPPAPVEGGQPSLDIEITNLGSEPATVRMAGFRFDAPRHLFDKMFTGPWSGLEQGHIAAMLIWEPETTTIPPHEVRRMAQDLPDLPQGAHLDFPIRAFAVDTHDRTWWATGEAWAQLRMWASVADDSSVVRWPPADTSPVQTDPLTETWDQRPVVSRWQASRRRTAFVQGLAFDKQPSWSD
jgi:hypothetical protein